MVKKISMSMVVFSLAFAAFFRTGCAPDPDLEAKNVMLAQDYWFQIIGDIVVTAVTPALASEGIAVNAPITCDVDHELPLLEIIMTVRVNGNPVAGSLEVTSRLLGGKHVVWTPEENYPALSRIDWTIEGVVDNGH